MRGSSFALNAESLPYARARLDGRLWASLWGPWWIRRADAWFGEMINEMPAGGGRWNRREWYDALDEMEMG